MQDYYTNEKEEQTTTDAYADLLNIGVLGFKTGTLDLIELNTNAIKYTIYTCNDPNVVVTDDLTKYVEHTAETILAKNAKIQITFSKSIARIRVQIKASVGAAQGKVSGYLVMTPA